jgi:hypothetical protein
MKIIFIPESKIETTRTGRFGEVIYWVGILIAGVCLFASFNAPEILIGIPVSFFLGRAVMYILAGR